MTTKEAFRKVIEDKAILDKIGINDSTGRSIRKRFNDGNLSTDKMEAILIKAGAKVKQEKLWKL